MKTSSANIAIIGNGAIGQLWAHYLTLAGHQVTLIGRRDGAAIQAYQLQTLAGDSLSQPMRYLGSKLPKSPELLIVTTKAYQVADALNPMLSQLVHCPIVLMHNGLGSVEQLALSPSHQVLLATTSHAALKSEQGIAHTGKGQTTLGRYQGIDRCSAQSIVDLLNHALPLVTLSEDIEATLWRKLAINCVINPLTALNKCTNGQLSDAQYQPQIGRIITEISHLMQAMTIDLDETSLHQTIAQVITDTARNYSSMHQDIIHQRPTEIEHINGYVVRKGQEHGIATPENEKLWLAIKSLTSL